MVRIGKNAAKILLILSGIVFLAHSAIPHHHHYGLVCIETEHCENCTLPNDSNQSNQDHQHGTDSKPGQCCISDFIPVSSKNGFRVNSSDASNEDVPDFYCCILPEIFRISTLFIKAEIPEPDIKLLYTSFARLTSGLRAPPVV